MAAHPGSVFALEMESYAAYKTVIQGKLQPPKTTFDTI